MIIFLGTLTITCIQRFRQNQANETVYRRKVKGSITTDWASSHYWSQRYTPRIIIQYQSTLSTFSTYKFNTLFPTSPQWRMITIIPPQNSCDQLVVLVWSVCSNHSYAEQSQQTLESLCLSLFVPHFW